MIKKQLKGTLVGTLSLAMILGNISTAGAAADVSPLADMSIKVTGTNSNGDSLWKPLSDSTFTAGSQKGDASIVVDSSVTYQKYAGVGFSLDETSVSNLWKLDENTREETIKHLVSTKDGAGLDQFRITIGSPDCIEHIPFWSYDDLPEGVKDDFELKYFSIEKDKQYHIIDTIKLIQKYNPDAKFFGSAWSAPGWMTTTGTLAGKPIDGKNESQLRDDCIEVFAKYYAKTIKAFEAEGITFSAITELNEPGMDVMYPSMHLSIEQQQKLAIAIKKEFKEQGIQTELWMHDFNFWDWKYGDVSEYKNHYQVFEGKLGKETAEAADGVGFHPYWGEASVMWDTYYETGKPVYLTEAGGMDPGTILSYFRFNCSSYNGWTQITDQNGGTLHWTDDKSEFIPETDIDKWTEIGNRPGAHWTDRLVTVNTDSKTVSYNNSVLGGLAQMAKYLDYGATRLYSSDSSNGITNVVYCNKETDTSRDYVMVINNTGDQKTVDVNMAGMSALLDVPSGYSTFQWTMDKVSAEGNHKPAFAKADNVTATQFEKMTCQLSATDEDKDALTYYGLEIPSGASVDPSTGLVEWTPGASGEYTFKVAVTDGKENATTEFKVTVESAPVPVPGTINKIEVGTAISNNDTQTYQLDVKETGNYILTVNYSTSDIWSIDGQKIDIAIDGKEVDSKDLAVTWSGSGAVRMPISLETGMHDLKLTYHATNYTVNYLEITKAITHNVPGKVEAEDYTNSYGLNLEPEGAAYKLSEAHKNDWAEYQIDADADGSYTLGMRSGTPNAGVTLDISVDGKVVSNIDMKKTGDDWGVYEEGSLSTPFDLTKGSHVIRITFTSEVGGNIDYLTLEKTGEIQIPDEPDTPSTDTLKKGAVFSNGNYKYKVTNAKTNGSGTVALTGFAKGKSAKTVKIPNTVKAKGVTYKVTSIANKAFSKDKKVQSVNVPNNVTTIGNQTFSGAAALKTITIGTGLTKIGTKAFANLSKLKTVTIKSKKLTKADKKAFNGIKQKFTIKVPKSKVNAYKKLFPNQKNYIKAI